MHTWPSRKPGRLDTLGECSRDLHSPLPCAAAHRGRGEGGGSGGGGRQQQETDGVVAKRAVDQPHHEGWEEAAEAAGGTDHPGDRPDWFGPHEPGEQGEHRAGCGAQRRGHPEEGQRADRHQSELGCGQQRQQSHAGVGADEHRHRV